MFAALTDATARDRLWKSAGLPPPQPRQQSSGSATIATASSSISSSAASLLPPSSSLSSAHTLSSSASSGSGMLTFSTPAQFARSQRQSESSAALESASSSSTNVDGSTAASSTVTCMTCMEDVPAGDMRSLWCGHEFCVQCWRRYLCGRFEDLTADVRVTGQCMQPKCSACATAEFLADEIDLDGDECARQRVAWRMEEAEAEAESLRMKQKAVMAAERTAATTAPSDSSTTASASGDANLLNSKEAKEATRIDVSTNSAPTAAAPLQGIPALGVLAAAASGVGSSTLPFGTFSAAALSFTLVSASTASAASATVAPAIPTSFAAAFGSNQPAVATFATSWGSAVAATAFASTTIGSSSGAASTLASVATQGTSASASAPTSASASVSASSSVSKPASVQSRLLQSRLNTYLWAHPQLAICPSGTCRVVIHDPAVRLSSSTHAPADDPANSAGAHQPDSASSRHSASSVQEVSANSVASAAASASTLSAADATGSTDVSESGSTFRCPCCAYEQCKGECPYPAHDPAPCAVIGWWTTVDKGYFDLGGPEALASRLAAMTTKKCPRCKEAFQKDKGCRHITCPCGHNWCWDCGNDYPCRKCTSGLNPSAPPPVDYAAMMHALETGGKLPPMDKSIALQTLPEAIPLCSDNAAERSRFQTQVNSNIAFLSAQVDAAVNRKRELLQSVSKSHTFSFAAPAPPLSSAIRDAAVAALDALVDTRKVLMRNFIIEFYSNCLHCSALPDSRLTTIATSAKIESSAINDPLAVVAGAHAVSVSTDSAAVFASFAAAHAAGKEAASTIPAATAAASLSYSSSQAGHRLFLYMSRRLHADAAALQVALDTCTASPSISGGGKSGATVSASATDLSVSAMTRATALVRLRLGALLKTFDRAFVPRTDRVLPQNNRAGAAMRLGAGFFSSTFYCGRRLGRALFPGSRSGGQCGPDNGMQCLDCAAAAKPRVVNSAPSSAPPFALHNFSVSASASGASSSNVVSSRTQWLCDECTLLNVAEATTCDACNAARP